MDNVAVPALLGRTMDAQAAYARAYDLLARVGLAERADAYPGSMSGGEQRRAVVARALINSPPLLLADEPTSDLDEDTEADIIGLLEALQRTEAFGLALVTHDLQLAKRAQQLRDAAGRPGGNRLAGGRGRGGAPSAALRADDGSQRAAAGGPGRARADQAGQRPGRACRPFC